LCQEGLVSPYSFENQNGISFEAREGNQVLNSEILKNKENDVVDGLFA